MNHKQFLIQKLETVNAHRKKREYVANLVLNSPELFPALLEITFDLSSKNSIKAAWVLEIVCERKLNWIAPNINYFITNAPNIKEDSALRPLAKICSFIASKYSSNPNSKNSIFLSAHQIEKLIEINFEWFLGKQKVAVKVYAMETLFQFGKENNWIYNELPSIIELSIPRETAAYAARGKKILKAILKFKRT